MIAFLVGVFVGFCACVAGQALLFDSQDWLDIAARQRRKELEADD